MATSTAIKSFTITTWAGKEKRRGHIVNRYFAVSRDHESYGRRYRITHLPTGWACAKKIKSLPRAVKLARTLTIRYGTNWNFTDPTSVKGNQVFAKVRDIIAAAGATV